MIWAGPCVSAQLLAGARVISATGAWVSGETGLWPLWPGGCQWQVAAEQQAAGTRHQGHTWLSWTQAASDLLPCYNIHIDTNYCEISLQVRGFVWCKAFSCEPVISVQTSNNVIIIKAVSEENLYWEWKYIKVKTICYIIHKPHNKCWYASHKTQFHPFCEFEIWKLEAFFHSENILMTNLNMLTIGSLTLIKTGCCQTVSTVIVSSLLLLFC